MPRRALWWLIACQLYVLIPHLTRVPLWVLGICVGAALWRLQMHRERLGMPPRLLRMVLGLGGAAGVIASYQTLVGLEPMVALLLVASGLKLIEAMRLRDGYTVVSLSFFVMTCEFLFYQELPIVLYAAVGTVLLITSLIAMNTQPQSTLAHRAPWLALRMLALALPMMAVLFILFPRIGPLWSIPSKSGQGTTGMSDTLRPGDVSRLSRSAEVAFRAQFDSDIPPKRALYWRGMVLNQFDDGAWRTLDWRDHPPAERQFTRPPTEGEPLRYRIIMEPSFQNWLYAIPYAESATRGVIEAWDYRLGVREPVENSLAYDVVSWPETRLGTELSAWRREVELALPPALNPRTQVWVAELAQQHKTPAALVTAVLRYFSEQPFYYTLEPPPIRDDSFVDRFLFDTRRGFCEHYAYSFVVAMRMAGIPARIIGGYQGGEVNPLNNSVVVRQFDAHAWAEVWLSERGWVRVDPTAAVAPNRVELGLEAALDDGADFLTDSPFSAYRFRGIGAINWLRLRYDAAAWRWQSFIVGFDSDAQIDLLTHWFGEIKVSRFVALMLGSWLVVLLPLTWWLNRDRRRSARLPAEQQFAHLTEQLVARGVSRQIGESPAQLLQRASAVLAVDDPLLASLKASQQQLYAPPNSTGE